MKQSERREQREKAKYGWMKRLIDKITNSNQSNNDYFNFYGHEINLSSGTTDYVAVDIYDVYHCDRTWKDPKTGYYHCESWQQRDHIASFDFDYLTMELHLEYYETENIRTAIIKGFKHFYPELRKLSDDGVEEDIKTYESHLGDPDYDQEDVEKSISEAQELLNLENY